MLATTSAFGKSKGGDEGKYQIKLKGIYIDQEDKSEIEQALSECDAGSRSKRQSRKCLVSLSGKWANRVFNSFKRAVELIPESKRDQVFPQ